MFDLQGHRGARGLFPENTVHGFESAMRLGLRSFELDVGISADGVPVVHHDPHLNPDLARDADGRWIEGAPPLLRALTLAQLQRYDVGRLRPGSAYAARYPTQIACDGARIPTLEQVLRLPGDARWTIELKLLPDHPDWTVSAAAMTELVLAVIDRVGVAGRVTMQSFDWRVPRHVRRIRPEIARAWLTRAETIGNAALWRGETPFAGRADAVPEAIEAEGGGTWTPYYAELDQEALGRAHELGVKVVPWTVNEPADMRRLIRWGVDGLITDWPDRAFAVLHDTAAAPPA